MEYTMLEDIKAKFGKEGLAKCCLRQGGEQQLCELIEKFVVCGRQVPLEILELGTWNGVSAIVLSRYGNVTTYDPVKGPLFDAMQEAFPPIGKILDIICGSPEATRDAVAMRINLEDVPQFTLAFVDSSKDYGGLARDFEAVKSVGRVIFDDYWKDPAAPKRSRRFHGVCQFVDSIPEGRLTKTGRFVLWESLEILEAPTCPE